MPRQLRIIRRLPLAIAAVFLSASCAAEVITQENMFSFSLEELLQIKVTSSTLTEESLLTAPASVTVFTHEQIKQLGVNTLEELMNHVAGYQSYRTDDGSSVFSSRSRRLTGGSREVLVLLDGQRLNHDAFGHTNSYESEMQLDNVARVEFIRGPGSALYGANAFLGVINIVTATDNNELSISGTSHQKEKLALSTSQSFDNGLQSSLSVQGTTDKGEQQSLYDPINKTFRDEQQSINTSSIYWRAQWGEWALQARNVEHHIEDGYVLGSLGDDYVKAKTRTSLIALKYTHVFDDHWQFSSRLYDTPYSSLFRTRQTAAPRISTNTFSGSESGSENRLSWHEGTANALLGVDYVRNEIDKAQAQLWFPPAVPLAKQDILAGGSRTVKAFYAQWQDALCDDFTYILGVRNDSYSDVDGYTSPRLGLIWQASEANTFKLLYGEAFRAPARNELEIKNNFFQVGNPNLKPEISKTTELIWMHTAVQHYSSINVFDTTIEDPVLINTSVPLPRPFLNGSSQHISGIEMELRWYFSDDWQLQANLNHLFHSAVTINTDSENAASVSLLYNSEKFTFSLSDSYHGVSEDENNVGYNRLGGYTLLDAHIHYQLTSDWQLYANLLNLTDKNYILPAAYMSSNIIGVPGKGREVEVGVRWRF